jgi:hypothetical protein
MTETTREPVARGRLATAWAIPPVYAAGALGLAILLDRAGAATASRFWYVAAVVLVPVVLWLAFLLTQPRGDAAGWAVVAWVVAAAPVQLVLAWVLSALGQGFGAHVLWISAVALLLILMAFVVWVSSGDDTYRGGWAP